MRKLSAREINVLQCAADGLTRIETGRKLFVSDSTVQKHRLHICDLMRARNTVQAVAMAIRQGIIE